MIDRKRLCDLPCYQHPEKAVVEAKLNELDGLWTGLNAQAKVRRQQLNSPTYSFGDSPFCRAELLELVPPRPSASR